MGSDPSSLASGITFTSVPLPESFCDPYLDTLVECYKDENHSKLNESHDNHAANASTENLDHPDDDFIHEDIGSNKTSIKDRSLTGSSTYMYEKEPFDTYRCKVNQLCIDIGLVEPSTIKHLDGGSYNRVIGLPFRSDSGIQRRILRIPQKWDMKWSKQTDIQNQAEINMWLQKFAFLHVPKVLAIDTTAANSLKSPSVLQERIQGIPLDDLFFEVPTQLAMSMRLEVVNTIAEFIIKLETTTLDKPGRLVGTHAVPWTSTSVACSASRIEFAGFSRNFMESAPPLENQDLYSLLPTMIKAHQTIRTQNDAQWEMSAKHFFKSSDSINVLWHWYLEPRHIFVGKSETGRWEVSGVIDWDDVKSMPLFLTRAPSNFTFPWNGDYDELLDLPLNQDVTILKEYFDRIMQDVDPTYMDDTYGRGFWIRRLARFARDGFYSPESLEVMRSLSRTGTITLVI
ncbi:uncharacterized protein Bfra_012379 [Botrytis fragariae]|uniref:Aminoglycoside phosphotransferase domain-containing protein n=1 Tax=Botrytis fragariae TaxID=1964551 RepID=A0A8H6EDN8_9HELO|nr:uncharacterized protein Bfra_012379 [Botrytis fragariae]KAF5868469.1 hypothetical protein Bfra_012379 [Botrytis fragariae]